MTDSLKNMLKSVDWSKMVSGGDARNALVGSALGGLMLGGAGLMQDRDPEESRMAPVGDALMGALLGGAAGYGIPKGLALFRDSGGLAPDDDRIERGGTLGNIASGAGWGAGSGFAAMLAKDAPAATRAWLRLARNHADLLDERMAKLRPEIERFTQLRDRAAAAGRTSAVNAANSHIDRLTSRIRAERKNYWKGILRSLNPRNIVNEMPNEVIHPGIAADMAEQAAQTAQKAPVAHSGGWKARLASLVKPTRGDRYAFGQGRRFFGIGAKTDLTPWMKFLRRGKKYALLGALLGGGTAAARAAFSGGSRNNFSN